MMMKGTDRYRVGEMRPSQLMFSFGVGASVDLPHLTVMVMGLEDWPVPYMGSCEISEERLLLAIKQPRIMGPQVTRLLSPPPRSDDTSLSQAQNEVGVPVAAFPRWMRCPKCELLARVDSRQFDLKTDPFRPDRARYVHTNCRMGKFKAPTVLPARFVLACENGHLDDFPWLEFVHGGTPCAQPRLKMTETGSSGDAASVIIICENCEAKKPMSVAFEKDFGKEGSKAGFIHQCRGREPHLRRFTSDCTAKIKTMLLGASNSWFPITLSALSIPTEVDQLGQLVEENWALLEKTESAQNIGLLQTIGQLNTLIAFDAPTIWKAVEAKRQESNDVTDDGTDLKTPEWQVFSAPESWKESRDFRLREVAAPIGYEKYFKRVVLAERLREVHALLGFTRIDSPNEWGEIEEIPVEKRGLLAKNESNWVPAVEVRGEGIFLQLNEGKVAEWCDRQAVRALDREWQKANIAWRSIRHLQPPSMVNQSVHARYILLHSISHALMRALCLECGYSSSSLRERLYCKNPDEENGPMAGILIYTAAPDSEGTLGGLVSLGEPKKLGRHLKSALDAVEICASDPLCSEHGPGGEDVSLHGSACHGCLFSPETSCERGNKLLDRKTIVYTLQDEELLFFDE